MAKDSKIEWTDDTVNAWWGCQKISPACANCYAESLDKRTGGENWGGADSPRRIRVEAAIRELDAIAARSGKEGRPRRVFLSSMSDVFEDRADLVEPRLKLWAALHRIGRRITPLLLTKRPHMMAEWARVHGWPEGAWAGTTVEDQIRADERIPALLKVPAPVRFLSMEPLLGRVDLITPIGAAMIFDEDRDADDRGIHWIIAGGESGGRARPAPARWFRSLRDQAFAAGAAFFFKQWGEFIPDSQVQHLPPEVRDIVSLRVVEAHGEAHVRYGKKLAGRLLDGEIHHEFPVEK